MPKNSKCILFALPKNCTSQKYSFLAFKLFGKLSAITDELARRGYKDSDIKKILGGNFLRVFRKVCDTKKKSDKK